MNINSDLANEWVIYAKALPAAMVVRDLLANDRKEICRFIDDVLRANASVEVIREIGRNLINEGYNHHGSVFIEDLVLLSVNNKAIQSCLNEYRNSGNHPQ